MSQKVVGIAAGEAHTLVLTGDGCVFSWGRGTFGRLGIGKEDDQIVPVPVRFDASNNLREVADHRGREGGGGGGGGEGGSKIVGIATGAYHSLALEDNGSVWSWGYNAYGQLGRCDENTYVPCLVDRFLELGSPDADREKKSLKVSSVKAGGMISLAIDSLGGLWMWGGCPQLSDADNANFCLVSSPPQLVSHFYGNTVVKVACGNEHVLALVSVGETSAGGDLICYSWGNNNHGQLGLGDTVSRTLPQILTTFNEESQWAIYEIACGAFHTAVLTQNKLSNEEIDCKCWTFGLGENGQLGHGTTSSLCLPEPINKLPHDAILSSIDCGLFHTCVVSAAGAAWSWGMANGLGLCSDASLDDAGDALSPVRLQSSGTDELRFIRPVQVACGAAHTVVAAGDGYRLWAWGRGRSGVLGTGHMTDSFVPCSIMWPPPNNVFEDEGLKIDDNRSIPQDDEDPLSAALAEVQLLQSKLSLMERYAGVLHVSVFGRLFREQDIPPSLQESNFFDIWRELENTMDSADNGGLARMEVFYRGMLASVKDRMMKRRIQEIVKECLASLPKESQLPPR